MNFTKPLWRPVAKLLCLSFFLACLWPATAQRSYKPASVLAGGAWYKISVATEGVYKIDVPFLSSIGISGGTPSSQIRLFGRTGGMLPEANATPRIDDLEEVAITVEDGGDGQLNGADYVLFYSPGPDEWKKRFCSKAL